MESPRAREIGDLFAFEPNAAFRVDLPFGKDDKPVPDLPSFCSVLSCDACRSFLLGVSSRGVRDRSSSGVLASGFVRFWGRKSPSVSGTRFLFSGVSCISWVDLDFASDLIVLDSTS